MKRGQSQSKFASNIHSIETKAHLHLGALLLLLVLLDDQQLAGGEGKGRVVALWDLRQRLLHLLPGLWMRRSFKLDPVGSTVRYEMMKLCTGSV